MSWSLLNGPTFYLRKVNKYFSVLAAFRDEEDSSFDVTDFHDNEQMQNAIQSLALWSDMRTMHHDFLVSPPAQRWLALLTKWCWERPAVSKADHSVIKRLVANKLSDLKNGLHMVRHMHGICMTTHGGVADLVVHHEHRGFHAI